MKLFSFKNDVVEPIVEYPSSTIHGDTDAVTYLADWDGRSYYTSPDSFNSDTHTMDVSLDYQYHESLEADLSRTLVTLRGEDPDDEAIYTQYGLTFDILVDDLLEPDPGTESDAEEV